MLNPATFSILADRSSSRAIAPLLDDGKYSIAIPRGNPAIFRVGVFEGSVPIDLSNVSSVELRIQPSQTEAGPLAITTINVGDPQFNELITSSAWKDEADQNFLLELTSAQTNQDLKSQSSAKFYAVITATATVDGASKEITLAGGVFSIVEDNNSAGDPPPDPVAIFATQDFVNAATAGLFPGAFSVENDDLYWISPAGIKVRITDNN